MMSRTQYKPDWQRALTTLSGVAVAAAIVFSLYWAQVILIPLALAVFFTFVLAPLVTLLQRRGLPRTPAVAIVVAAAVSSLGLTGYIITAQVAGLSDTLLQPENTARMKEKIGRVKGWFASDPNGRWARMVDEVQEAVSPTAKPKADARPKENNPLRKDADPDAPQKVVVEPPSPGWAPRLDKLVTPALEFAGQAAFAFILVVFMLLRREDLRNRLLRLAAGGRLTTATKAVDNASRRVARFLLLQLLINTAFGVIVSIGLYLIGVKYALLWGAIGTLMRYVPYIGTWIGVVPPVIFSMATTDATWQPFAVFAVFIGLEVVLNNFFEPWLFGQSLGMSEVAQLVAAAFWSFLWGPVGLILSGPITTCIMVLGKYVPQLRFLDILLGDEPPLAPSDAYFQRLTARDQDEASRIAAAQAREKGSAAVFDEVIVPALVLAKTAAEEGDLDAADQEYVLSATREVLEDMADAAGQAAPAAATAPERVKLLTCPARDGADQVAIEMLIALLDPTRWEVEVATANTLTSELVQLVETFEPDVVCVASLPPGGLAHTRYLCKRLKARFPDQRVIVGRWGQTDGVEDARKEIFGTEADPVYVTLEATRQQLLSLLPVLTAQKEDAAAPPAAVKTPGPRERVGTTPA